MQSILTARNHTTSSFENPIMISSTGGVPAFRSSELFSQPVTQNYEYSDLVVSRMKSPSENSQSAYRDYDIQTAASPRRTSPGRQAKSVSELVPSPYKVASVNSARSLGDMNGLGFESATGVLPILPPTRKMRM